MIHPIPWVAMLRKDGVYCVVDARGNELLAFTDDPRMKDLADLIAKSVNAYALTWLSTKRLEVQAQKISLLMAQNSKLMDFVRDAWTAQGLVPSSAEESPPAPISAALSIVPDLTS